MSHRVPRPSAKHFDDSLSPSAANDDVEREVRLIRLREVLRLTALSRSALYRLLAEGCFPRPVELTERSRAWVEHEVHDWVADKLQRR